jgi:hypothetical protein
MEVDKAANRYSKFQIPDSRFQIADFGAPVSPNDLFQISALVSN